MSYWIPQPGAQAYAAICPADEIGLLGTRGGGKSDLAIGKCIRGAELYAEKWNALYIRRKYKDLAEVRRRFDEIITQGMPAERIGGENQINHIRFLSGPAKGANISLVSIHELSHVNDFLGQQFTLIVIDEAPSIPFFAQLVDHLRGCLRSPHGIPCQLLVTGNPGGPGAAQVKQEFVPESLGGGLPVNNMEPYYTEDGTSRVYIHSVLEDNQILARNDPQYINRIKSIKDPMLRKAWVEGRWDVFIGQAFTFTERHIIDPIFPIPEHAPLYMTYDYGFGHPFSIAWWWIDRDGRLVRCAEWYGCEQDKGRDRPNVGLRLEDFKIAEGILERERELGILGRKITRLTNPDSFNKKADYQGGGQGPSTSDNFKVFANKKAIQDKYGKIDLSLLPADPKRELKIRQFRNRLMLPNNNELPMLVVYNTCHSFIRVIPYLCVDELTGEYLEKGQEDHLFDDAAQLCMELQFDDDENLNIAREQAKHEQVKREREKLDTASQVAAMEYDDIIKELMLKSGEQTTEEISWAEFFR